MNRPRVTAAVVVVGVLLASRLQVGSAASLTLTSQAYTPYRTCTITATPTTTTAVSDANVRQGSATTNFGTVTTINVSSALSANQRIYLKFDLSQCSPTIPTTATVRLATLRLFMSTVPTVCRTIDIFKVTSTWTEAAITWNTQPFGTALNNPASASASDTFTVGTPAGCTNQAAAYITDGDVTTDVTAFVASPATNFGWMLRDDVESSATARTATFSAKELGTLAREPQLVVSYVTVP